MNPKRSSMQHVLKWQADETHSNVVLLSGGAWGTLIVPAALNGETVNIHTELIGEIGGVDLTAELDNPADFTDVPLLSTPKTLTTGANALTTDEMREVGPVGPVRFVLGSAPASDVEGVLWWKD